MPTIEDLHPRVPAAGPVDYAGIRPNQAFADLGRQAKAAEVVLEEHAHHDAVLEGASALADFRAARAKRQQELRTQAKDLEGFTDAALADFDEAADKLITGHENPRVQQFLEERLIDARTSEEMESDAWAGAAIVDRRATKTAETVNKFANSVTSNPSSFQSALSDVEAMIDAAGLPLDAADKARTGARAVLARAAVYGQIEKAPGAVLKQLNGGQWDTYLDNDAKITAVNAAQAEIHRREAIARERANAAAAAAASNVEVLINRFNNGQGTFTQEQLDALRGQLKPQAFNQLQMAFDDARAQRAKADAERLDASALIDAGGHIDPGNDKQVKAYDAYFRNSFLPELDAGVSKLPPDQQSEAKSARILAFIGKQGVVPESVESSLRSTLRSGTPAERASAAAMVNRIKVVAPRALNDLDDDMLRQANDISSYLDAGLPEAEAVRRVDEALARPKVIDDALGAAYDEDVTVDTTANWLADQMGGWWSSPSVGLLVATEVHANVRREYQRNGGNLEGARRTALDMAKRRYGATKINGTWEVMRNAPEAHYGLPWQTLDQAADAIRDEAFDDLTTAGALDVMPPSWSDYVTYLGLRGAGGVGADVYRALKGMPKDPLTQALVGARPFTKDRMRILPYPMKGVTAPDGRPVYAMEVQDSAGAWTVQVDMDPKSPTFGLPKPWWPSLTKVKEARQEEVRRAIDAAKAARPENIRLQAGDLGL